MAGSTRHRHVVEGGYACGEETRARIVTAALRLFGEHGFAGASTRDIATHAQVNAPALQYYFENKEGVYLACVEHIVSRVWECMADVVDRAERVLAGDAGDDALIEAFCAVQEQTADFMFTAEDARDWRLFMARLQAGAGPTAGFQLMYQRVTRRISGVMAAMVGRLAGLPADDDETLIRTMALSGQLTVFQVYRRSALHSLDWDTVDAERLALLKRVIRQQTEALLRSLTATRGARPVAQSTRRDSHGQRGRPRRVERTTKGARAQD
jgi:TetR/AcrR family transcriptional regulator, regulator of cefoperazone and chloramphenicol sensitivity